MSERGYTQSDQDSDTWKLVFWGVVGIGAVYLIWQLLSKAGSAVSSAGTAVANATLTPLANAYVALTAGPAAVPAGSIIMPDGSYIPSSAAGAMTTVPNSASPAGVSGTFNYGGQQYFINSGADSNGNYTASTALSYP